MRTAASLALFALVGSHVFAQIPFTPGGKPDFSGVWHLRGKNLAPASNESDIPYTSAGRGAWKNVDLKNDPIVACLYPGVPRIMSMDYPMQIVQSADSVVMLFEFEHIWRFIPLGRPHDARLEPSLMGDSVGAWEGSTLTIDTTGFKGSPWTWLDSMGHPHSDALRVVERLRRLPEGVEYQVTLQDSVMYSRPWALPVRLITPLTTPAGLNGLMEYSCNENNRDLDHLVSTVTVDYRWDPLHPRGMLAANPRGAVLLLVLFGATAIAGFYKLRHNAAGRSAA